MKVLMCVRKCVVCVGLWMYEGVVCMHGHTCVCETLKDVLCHPNSETNM